jgi:hypothetical protein
MNDLALFNDIYLTYELIFIIQIKYKNSYLFDMVDVLVRSQHKVSTSL